MSLRKRKETEKCALYFEYFCKHYIKIISNDYKNRCDSKKVSFNLFAYQKRLFNHLENNKNIIFSKFHFGGFTTFMLVYGIWRCLFRLNERILYIGNGDKNFNKFLDIMYDIPIWMKDGVSKRRDGQYICNFKNTGSSIIFRSSFREKPIKKEFNFLIFDEAAQMVDFTKNINFTKDNLRTCVFGQVDNNESNFFWNLLENAKVGFNAFSVYENYYWERPDFAERDRDWFNGCFITEFGQRPLYFDVS